MRVSVLGLGSMGQAIAGRLLDTGHSVGVWNRTAGRAAALTARGATEVAGPPAAFDGADVVLSSLSDDAAVRAVLLDGGVLGQQHGGTDRDDPGGRFAARSPAVVDCSTISPVTARALAEAYGDRFAACPILGAPAAVAEGRATLLLAGPGELVARLAPLWDDLSAHQRRVGDDPGLAQAVKLLANYLLMAGIVTLAEATAVGQAAGLDDATLEDVLSALAAPNVANRVTDVVSGDHRGWFSTLLGAKDVHLLVDLARRVGVGLPVASLVAARYDEAAGTGLADLDIGAVVELHRRGGSARRG